MRSARVRRFLVATLALAGCAGWQRIRTDAPPPVDPDDPVQVWSHERLLMLYGVRVWSDSVTGRKSRPECGRSPCRVTIARADVDSVRVVSGTDAGAGSFALGFVVGLVGVVVVLSHGLGS